VGVTDGVLDGDGIGLQGTARRDHQKIIRLALMSCNATYQLR
jgi:hypothetical protein